MSKHFLMTGRLDQGFCLVPDQQGLLVQKSMRREQKSSPWCPQRKTSQDDRLLRYRH